MQMKEIIRREFQKYGGAIAMDCWTDAGTKTAYFGLTVHYTSRVEGQLMLNDRVLVIRELSAETVKSGEYLRSKIIDYLREFDLEDCIDKKLVFISDRGTNMVSAVRAFNSVHCFAHLLNNTLSAVFKKDNSKPADQQSWAFRKVQAVTSIVKYFKSSSLAKRFKPTLQSNICTRWNSIGGMLDSVIHHWELINQILRTSNKRLDDLNSITLHELEMLRDFCKPFKTSTDELEASKHPTLAHVIPNFLKISNHLQASPYDPNCIAECKEIALKYWTENVRKQLTIHHGIALFLHPLTKHLKTQKPDERNEIWTHTISLMNEFMPPTNTHQEQPSASAPTRPVDVALSLCMGDSDHESDGGDESESQSELNDYKKIRLRGEDTHNLNLLNWWDINKRRFPRLYGVARFIHSIPASSAAAERLFSIAGRLVSFRPNMRSDLVDEMLFLKSNLDLSRNVMLRDENIDVDAIETITLDQNTDSDDDEVEEIVFDIECDR